MVEPDSSQLSAELRILDPVDLLFACGSLVQSYSNSEAADGVGDLVDNLLAENSLGTFSLDIDSLKKYRTTYVCLSHHTVKVLRALTLPYELD